MLLGLTYQLMRFITDLVLVRTHSDAQLRAEVLALRHQLRVLERKVGKPAWQPGDRIVLAGLSRLLPRSGLASLLPKPEMLLRWHRDLVRRKWSAAESGGASTHHIIVSLVGAASAHIEFGPVDSGVASGFLRAALGEKRARDADDLARLARISLLVFRLKNGFTASHLLQNGLR